jgi:hypothetical protein
MRKTKKNMKFKNKKKNYYKRLPLLAKAGMIADRSSPTTVPKGKPVGVLSSLFRSSSVPVGTPLYLDNYQEVPAREPLYPELIDIPSTPIRISSISSSDSEKNFYDAIDPIVELEKAEIRANGAQRAAAKATAAREVAEAYVINRQRAVTLSVQYAASEYGGRRKDWVHVVEQQERLANARQALKDPITMEEAAVALAEERKKELQDAIIKANEFKAATKKSLSRRAIDASRRIARAVSGSTRKKQST